ncbi:MAG: hypothetical protein IPM51_02995 [Sphingobacteriaceae bacterium]|nr:hypothetical protein [Sphingobacteriaceae bacterium]
MKKLIIFSILFLFYKSSKAQCIFVYASQRIKGVEIPIERTEFDIVINDTIKKHATSANDGSLGRISLPQGIYEVKISNPEFNIGIKKNVIVRESRTTDVIINLTMAGTVKEEDKLKKIIQD